MPNTFSKLFQPKSLIKLLLIWFSTIVLFFIWGGIYGSAKPSNEKFIADTIISLNIIIGILSFIALVITVIRYIKEIISQKHKIKKIKTSDRPQNLMIPKKNIFSLFNSMVVAVIVIVAFLFGRQQNFMGIADLTIKKAVPTSIIQIPTVTYIPVKSETKIYPTAGLDPPVHCQIHPNCGGGTIPLKKSECEKTICCLYPDRAVFMRDKSQCVANQGGNNISSQTLPPFDCSIGDQKVKMTNMNDCYNAMNAYWISKGQTQKVVPTTQPLQPPAPTTDQAYNDLLQRHQDACNKAVGEWISFKENFTATQINNYSNSADGVRALEAYRQQYQQELYSAGCTNTISL